jgi:hypothetical protein
VDTLGLLTLAGDDVVFDDVVLPDPARDGTRIVLESGLSLTVGIADAAGVGTATQHDHAIADWLGPSALYDAALEWRRRNPTAQIAVSPAIVQALAAASTVRAPAGEFSSHDPATLHRKQALAGECVARALDNALNRSKRAFYAARMKPAPLCMDGNANFPFHDAADGSRTLAIRIEAETREDLAMELRNRIEAMQRGGVLSNDTAGKMLAALNADVGAGDVSARVQALLKQAVGEAADDGSAPLPRLYCDQHLYAPLFVAQPFESRNGQLALFGAVETGVRLTPPALVASEARFVHDLRTFWAAACNTAPWQDHEIYLLRNQARTGLGFFTGAGFYPDFLLWMKHGARQVLCFVEPKGLGRAWPQAKIDLLAALPTQSPADLPLRGFMLTPTSLADIRQLQPDMTEDGLASANILLQDHPNYIQNLLEHLHHALPARAERTK